jgi:hypothetical protein
MMNPIMNSIILKAISLCCSKSNSSSNEYASVSCNSPLSFWLEVLVVYFPFVVGTFFFKRESISISFSVTCTSEPSLALLVLTIRPEFLSSSHYEIGLPFTSYSSLNTPTKPLTVSMWRVTFWSDSVWWSKISPPCSLNASRIPESYYLIES